MTAPSFNVSVHIFHLSFMKNRLRLIFKSYYFKCMETITVRVVFEQYLHEGFEWF
jgi:hypothetical protein